jgi:hypothetical protein
VNSKDAEPGERSEVGGLGLHNVSKRLEYLYKNKHRLTVVDEGEVFVVMLELQLEGPKQNAPIYHLEKTSQPDAAEMSIGR